VSAPVLTLIAQWRNTADVWADPNCSASSDRRTKDGWVRWRGRLRNEPGEALVIGSSAGGTRSLGDQVLQHPCCQRMGRALPPGSGQHREGVG